MTAVSARKLAANRANAAASTGPRTAAGKARSSRNGVRHGLCSQTRGDPAIIRAIERLGRELAGHATGEERSLAYRVAAAQVDLERAQEAQRKVWDDPRLGAVLAAGGMHAGSLPDEGDVDATVELLEDTVYELEAIKRYEDRAFGQRRRAIRQLDGLRNGDRPRARRPALLGLARWRMRPPSFRIIRFEGLPRWAWWRPDAVASARAGAARPLSTPPPQRGPHGACAVGCPAGEGAAPAATGAPPTPCAVGAGGGGEPLQPASVPAAAAAAAPLPSALQSGEANPRRWGATPIPIPTCRVGPCRWIGEPPANHWSTRGWRYKRKPFPTRSRGPPW